MNCPALTLALFDLDGTLTDYPATINRALGHIYRNYQLQLTGVRQAEFLAAFWSEFDTAQERYHRGQTSTTRKGEHLGRFLATLERLRCSRTELASQMARQYAEITAQMPVAVPGMANLLRMLAHRSTVGVLTEGEQMTQSRKLLAMDMDESVSCLIASDAVGLHKPDPALWQYALRRFGIPAEKTVMVGNSVSFDLIPARKAGCRTILWIGNRRSRPHNDQCAANIDAVAFSLDQLKGILFGWINANG